ncbi:hypothetical protein [Nocardia beijingensis]|uniref:Uncharacterized protein n=1 Tax=Nocardia beijingensis TaxID=95162 RepID=A0ABW7WPH3_9NOCA
MPDIASPAVAYEDGPAGGPWVGIRFAVDPTRRFDLACKPAAPPGLPPQASR